MNWTWKKDGAEGRVLGCGVLGLVVWLESEREGGADFLRKMLDLILSAAVNQISV